MLGVSARGVQKIRAKRGIPPFRAEASRIASRIDWDDVSLGSQPDSALARLLGVNKRRVCAERGKRGIPAFQGFILTQEGDPCRSVHEAMYDAYLHAHGLTHQHEVSVPGLPFIADFRVTDEFVEIAGMTAFARYRAKYEAKRAAYERAKVRVRWLFVSDVEDLFRNCSIPLRFRPGRECHDCRKPTCDLVRGVCRPCYMRRWHGSGDGAGCASCGARISRKGARFCSRKCYWRSLELELPSWEELDVRLAQKPIRQVAIDLGVNPSMLYMRLRRRSSRAQS
jgi:hypothetical protein